MSEWLGLLYLVMPFMRCESLHKLLVQEWALGLKNSPRLTGKWQRDWRPAHAQGLVHRDIKPANILLEDGVDRLTITDFGRARAVDDASVTRSRVIAGTPQYMSPEQARGDVIDAPQRSVQPGEAMLYAMCTGRTPFRAETSYGILRRITDAEPRPIREINPEIPAWLADSIGKLLAKNPDARFASAAEVAELFEQCLAHVQQPTVVPLPDACQTSSRPHSSVRRWIILGGIVILGSALEDSCSFKVRPDHRCRTERRQQRPSPL